MSSLRSSVVLSTVLTLAACGGSSPPPAEHAEHGRARVAEVDALHEEIAPVFHAEAGAVRAAAACEHASALHDRSAAVQAATAPAGVDGAHWQDETSELVRASDALTAECAASGPAVEERLSDVHSRFHGVMELAYGHDDDDHHEHHEGGEHHDDGDHRDGDHHDGDHHDGDDEQEGDH